MTTSLFRNLSARPNLSFFNFYPQYPTLMGSPLGLFKSGPKDHRWTVLKAVFQDNF